MRNAESEVVLSAKITLLISAQEVGWTRKANRKATMAKKKINSSVQQRGTKGLSKYLSALEVVLKTKGERFIPGTRGNSRGPIWKVPWGPELPLPHILPLYSSEV